MNTKTTSQFNSIDELVLKYLNGILLNDVASDSSKSWDFFPNDMDWQAFYDKLESHAVLGLVDKRIFNIPNMPDDIKAKWQQKYYVQLYYNNEFLKSENELLSDFQNAKIPVVVLKGTSAACYYSNPLFRKMGDIDLLTRKEYYDDACKFLLNNGWAETSSEYDITRGRHTTYRKGKIMVELHRFFSSIMSPEKSEIFDSYLYEDIELGKTKLSDAKNGLVLIEHIAQHLNSGIGLRQIIDWMMFVNSCLDDDMWNKEFYELAKSVGMDSLAIVTTRMCQIYLGLRDDNITWCKSADENVCKTLMKYILDSISSGKSGENVNASRQRSTGRPRR